MRRLLATLLVSGLRDYGTARWEGGDETCEHKQDRSVGSSRLRNDGHEHIGPYDGEKMLSITAPYRDVCGKCGARRIDAQIGLEATPELFVATMVEVFREVRRVLRDDGTVWLNLGDSYASIGHKKSNSGYGTTGLAGGIAQEHSPLRRENNGDGLKHKDLCGIPWRVAFALQADGWYLRSDIIWAKPNPMPESVTDRPTRSHEYIFLLSKSPRYYYDADAIREPHETFLPVVDKSNHSRHRLTSTADPTRGKDGWGSLGYSAGGRNRRDVWTINSEATPEAHFATFPQKLVEPCILAGTSEKGCCAECGAPRVRLTDVSYDNPGNRMTNGSRSLANRAITAGFDVRLEKRIETTGWRSSCAHDAPSVPCLVLDPFGGSMTVGKVAERFGRRWVGLELSEDYINIGKRRTAQMGLSL